MIFPRWSWLVSSSWFSIMIFLEVPSSVAKISTLKPPTEDSRSSRTISIPMASLRSAKFSSCASHFQKFCSSCGHIVRRSSIRSIFPSPGIFNLPDFTYFFTPLWPVYVMSSSYFLVFIQSSCFTSFNIFKELLDSFAMNIVR